MDKVVPQEVKEVSGEKYVLCRRVDHHNEVVKAGPKAPSTIGITDFHTIIKDHGLHWLELAQLLKINYIDIQKLNECGGWIEPQAKENLLKLLQITCARARRDICQFLVIQEGVAGNFNFPHSQDSIPHKKT